RHTLSNELGGFAASTDSVYSQCFTWGKLSRLHWKHDRYAQQRVAEVGQRKNRISLLPLSRPGCQPRQSFVTLESDSAPGVSPVLHLLRIIAANAITPQFTADRAAMEAKLCCDLTL